MAARTEGAPLENPKLADRAALMTRTRKRDVDKGKLRRSWDPSTTPPRYPRDLEPPVPMRLLDPVPEILEALGKLRPVDRADRSFDDFREGADVFHESASQSSGEGDVRLTGLKRSCRTDGYEIFT